MTSIVKYGVVLTLMTKDDLENVRRWRNTYEVRKRMVFQSYIPKAQHRKWFLGLTIQDEYFIIRHKNIAIGIFHLKSTNEPHIKEAGVFIGNKEYLGSEIILLAIISGMEYFFKNKSNQLLRAKVLLENKEGLTLNKSLGYKIIEQNDKYFLLEVSQSQFEKALRPFEKLLNKL